MNRPGLDLRLVAVIGVLAALVPLLFKDQLGVWLGWAGPYIWVVGLVVSFVAMVFYLSQFILPIRWQESWYEGFRLTMRYNFPFLITIVRQLRIRPNISGATPEAARHLPKSFLKHKAGIIESHQAPVIFKGPSFIRGAGPGFLRLKERERVTQVIDLRRHFRTMPVKALTRDGITILTGVSTIFHIKHEDNPAHEDLQFPFDQEAIFKVNFLGNFKSDDGEEIPWSERVTRQAASAVIGEISRYSLDELLQPDESRASRLEIIKGRVEKQVARTFEKYGIHIVMVGVAPFQVPDDIKEERINIWRAEWERRIDVEHGTAMAESDRRLKLARARAQIEMIEKLTDGLDSVHQADQDLKDVLALRLIEAIEESKSNAAVSALIPSQIVNDLKTIRLQVLGEKD